MEGTELAELARAAEQRGDRKGAARLWEKLSSQHPDDPDPPYRIGALFHELGLYVSALPYFQSAVRRGANSAEPQLRIAHCLVSMGRPEDALAIYRQLLDQTPVPATISAYLFALILTPGQSADFVAAEHRRLAALLETAPPAPRAASAGGLKHVGLVSGHLGSEHPIAQLIEPALERISRSGLKLTVYATRPPGPAQADRIRRYGGVESIHGLNDTDAAARIAAQGPDLLVDLIGHTSGARPGIFARRPAPRQAGFLGYTFTSGAPFMDAIIADPHVCPPQEESLYAERVIRLPACFTVFRPPPGMPEERSKVARDNLVFGSLNNAAKLNLPTIRLWARVVSGVADAHLLLKSRAFAEPANRARIAGLFDAAGLDPARLDFEGHSSFSQGMARYRGVDIALDPLVYNGCTTTAHALWMGTPVVSLPGRAFYARMGVSLLTAADRPEWIAADEDDYVRIARSLAADRGALRAEQQRLLTSLEASPLCDLNAYADSLSDAFRRAAALPA